MGEVRAMARGGAAEGRGAPQEDRSRARNGRGGAGRRWERRDDEGGAVEAENFVSGSPEQGRSGGDARD